MVEIRAQQAASAAENSEIDQESTTVQSPSGFNAVNIHSVSLKRIDSDEANQQLMQEQESANKGSGGEDMRSGRRAKRSRRAGQGARRRAAREQAQNADRVPEGKESEAVGA